jgi:hydroxymethylpyrimidine pyrophosphatase-like HAD family hydrolase
MIHRWNVTSFVDLDDTLFSSVRRQLLPGDLAPAATLENGEIISYSNSKQRFLRDLLTNTGELIPVTARNLSAYRRVLLPFHGLAVLSHGATILNAAGQIDREWQAHLHANVMEFKLELIDLLHRIEASPGFLAGYFRSWLVYDDEIPVYLVVKDNARNEQRLQSYIRDTFGEWLEAHSEFLVHNNGNNVAILAPGIRKENAVAYLMTQTRQQQPDTIFIGVGDSVTDEPFMRLCDFAVLMQGTQLASFLESTIQQHLQQAALTTQPVRNKG